MQSSFSSASTVVFLNNSVESFWRKNTQPHSHKTRPGHRDRPLEPAVGGKVNLNQGRYVLLVRTTRLWVISSVQIRPFTIHRASSEEAAFCQSMPNGATRPKSLYPIRCPARCRHERMARRGTDVNDSVTITLPTDGCGRRTVVVTGYVIATLVHEPTIPSSASLYTEPLYAEQQNCLALETMRDRTSSNR